MALIRRRPDDLWPRLERAFLDWPAPPFETWRKMMGDDQLKVEEFREGDELVVRAELPGVDPETDVDVTIVDGNLRIHAERRQEENVERRNYRRTEIRYGSFSRVVALPSGTQESDIKASYKDGILEVRAPLDEDAAKAAKIQISRS